jgi:hypothetical protein
MLAEIAALIAAMGHGAVHAAAHGQLAACEQVIARFVDYGGNLARRVSPAIRHDCGPRSVLSAAQVRHAEWFAVRMVSMHDS